jgi:hypothetical protein
VAATAELEEASELDEFSEPPSEEELEPSSEVPLDELVSPSVSELDELVSPSATELDEPVSSSTELDETSSDASLEELWGTSQLFTTSPPKRAQVSALTSVHIPSTRQYSSAAVDEPEGGTHSLGGTGIWTSEEQAASIPAIVARMRICFIFRTP